jgi:hypothetical protein
MHNDIIDPPGKVPGESVMKPAGSLHLAGCFPAHQGATEERTQKYYSSQDAMGTTVSDDQECQVTVYSSH